jgi:CRISPR/Cas system CMR-associated protein Cmr5 small subunit
MQIQRDGLGPTLAFLAAKGKEHHRRILLQLDTWVLTWMGAPQGRDGLLGFVLICSSDDYRRASSETLAYLAWLKRFVEAKNLGEGS